MELIPRKNPEFSGLIPPLSPEELETLEENILSEGKCREAVLTWKGDIIDGHNRFDICAKNGVTFEVREMGFETKEDAKIWVLENQLNRRNLTEAARIQLTEKKAGLLKDKARERQSLAGGNKKPPKHGLEPLLSIWSKLEGQPVNVRRSIARDAGVSEGTLHNFTQVRERGGPELLERVVKGEITINGAFRLLDSDMMKKAREADKALGLINKRLSFENDREGNGEILGLLNGLSRKLDALLETLKEKEAV